jgi:RNA polymerase sigma-70 factor (ECF subfamily)
MWRRVDSLEELEHGMSNEPIVNERFLQESAVAERFLETRNEDSFTDLFKTFAPQLIAFFRARNCELALAEDLAQEVMFIIYRKAAQNRDRTLFRAWMFKIARHALCRYYAKQTRDVETVDFEDVADGLFAANQKSPGPPAFEFLHWMAFLDSRERETLTLLFIEQREYHEIAAIQAIPIGTVKSRVFNAKKKLAPHLKPLRNITRKAA